MTKLQNTVAVVAGASSGIGREIAFELAKRGATVVCTARRAEKISQLVNDIKDSGGIAFGAICDFLNNVQVNEFAKMVASRYGKIDLWVNGVGVNNAMGISWEMSYDQWTEDLEGNLKTCYIGTMAAINIMKHQKSGRIINMAGGGVMHTEVYNSAYATAKTALVRFTESISLELTRENIPIKIFSFNPGLVRTERTLELVNKPETERFMPEIIDSIKNDTATPINLPASNIVFIANGMLDRLHGCLICGNNPDIATLLPKLDNIVNTGSLKLIFKDI